MANIRNGLSSAGATPLAGITGDVLKGANTARRFSTIGTSPDFFTPKKFTNMVGGERRSLLSPDYVLPSGPGADLFGNRLAAAQAHVGPSPTPIDGSHMASDQTRMNTTIPLVREYFIGTPTKRKLNEGQFSLPSVYGLSIIHKPRGQHGKAIKVLERQLAPTSLTPVAQRSALLTEGPLLGFNVEAWNHYMAMEQYNYFLTEPANYRTLTGADIWHGRDALEWTGWSWDGVVAIETMDGRSSKFTDDYRPNSVLGRGAYSGPTGNSKFVTVVTQGQQDILDYTGGRGLQEGATLHFLLTKVKLGGDGGTSQTYVTSSKSTPLSLPADGVHHKFTTNTLVQQRELNPYFQHEDDPLVHPFRPFQLVAIHESSGGNSLPPALKCYRDEWDTMHYDAHDMNIGRVFSAGYVYKRNKPVTSPDDPFFVPVTDGWQTMLRSRYTILLNANKDGGFGGV